jgi:hypothetical protein
VIVEANHEGGNDIESLTEVRERTKGLDSLNDAADTEQARDFPEHWQAIHVEANSGMTEQLRDVEKVSCAAAEIQNPFRSRQIEFKLANPANVNSNPAVEIEILGPVRAGICHPVSSANLFELDWINCLNDALCLQREPVRTQHSERVFSRAGQASAIDQFLYFVAKSHNSHLVAKQDNFN